MVQCDIHRKNTLNACYMAVSGICNINRSCYFCAILHRSCDISCCSENITFCQHYPIHWPLMLVVSGSRPAGFRGQCGAIFSASSPVKTHGASRPWDSFNRQYHTLIFEVSNILNTPY